MISLFSFLPKSVLEYVAHTHLSVLPVLSTLGHWILPRRENKGGPRTFCLLSTERD